MKGISRIDSVTTGTGSNRGWYVRAYRNGNVYSKLFSDSVHGGKVSGLKAAKSYRDNLVKKVKDIDRMGVVPSHKI